MRTVAVVQARMSSHRLPGKVLADLGGRSVLALLLHRLSNAEELDDIVVATSNESSDDVIVEACQNAGVASYRGPLKDVLERYRQAAAAVRADVIVRVTADCPLIDAAVVDELVRFFREMHLDYCGLGGEFPHGLDCEVFSREALDEAALNAILPYDREHVTPYLKARPVEFTTAPFQPITGMLTERWTLDETEDLHFLRRLVELLGERVLDADHRAIRSTLDMHPSVRLINRDRVVARPGNTVS